MKTLDFTITHAFYQDTVHVFTRNEYNQDDVEFTALCGRSYDNESVSVQWADSREVDCIECNKLYASILLDN